jgi:2-desacetyl-2-hydroxyethyl bacteriochlorophyllide A dehydrogenase
MTNRKDKMRQALFTAPGELKIEDAEIPDPARDQVRVRVEACGICGSDRAIFIGNEPVSPPVVLGHEFAGVVVARGPEVEGLQVGDRVAIDPNIVCGRCPFCRRGQINLCSRLTPLGIALPGGFAEYSLVPESNAYRMSDSISFEEAALVEPLSCCIRGIHQAGVQLGDVVVVLGAGPIGLLLIQLARLRGAGTVIVVEPDAERRGIAATLGADIQVDGLVPDADREAVMAATRNVGADVVIEASGRASAAAASLTLIRPGGTIVWFGVCPPRDRVAVAPFLVNERELSIRGSNLNPFTHQMALTLIERGRVRVVELISDEIGLDGLRAAIDPAGPQFGGKVIVKPGKTT